MRSLRFLLAMATIAAASPILAEPSFAADSIRYPLQIERQPLSTALQEFARQSGVQIIFFSKVTDGYEAPSLKGMYTAQDALERLLDQSDLTFRELNPKTIEVQPRAAVNDLKASAGASLIAPGETSAAAGLRFAQAPEAQAPSGAGQASSFGSPPDNAAKPSVAEIVVTAQKRIERLQDVPVPVTAISAEALVSTNQLRLQDYYTRIPGLNLTPDFARGFPQLIIRGVTTGGVSNPTVGVVVDDVPYGASTANGGGYVAPDIDPSDLARVEVLRGPQGTLYGASSLGGLLKFVTVDPSTEMLSGRVQAGLSGVHNGDQLGYNVRGTVNVPLSETWAVRASGFTRLDPGYIDNAQTGARGVNRGEAHGGRLSALWRPTGNLSVKLGALIQDITTDGWATVDLLPGLGELEQSTLRGTGGYQKKSEVYSATVTANVGRADLTAVSGYSVNTASDTLDLTPILSAVTDSIYGVTGTPSREHNETSKFTQEVRLALPIGEKVEWLLGAFYTDEDSEFVQHIQAADAGSGVVVGSVLLNSFPTAFKEYAAFTDVTVHLTDRFDVQVGGRESRNRQTYTDTLSGPLAGGTSVVPEVESKDSAFTYLVTPRFRVSPNLMIYARWASGYRAGGPNSVLPGSVLPRTFGPDTTQNYEIGVKGDLLARTLSFDASVYSIDWKDIQLLLNPTFGSYYANAGSARSQGIELSMEARPLASLTIAAWVAWNDAELTEDFPATSSVYGASGDRLPYSSRFSGNISLDQEFPLTGGATGFAGGTLSYTGARQDVFTASALQPRNVFPAYAKTDLHAGVKYEDWTASLFINNAADRRGVIASGLVPGTVGYVQPRTVGLALAKSF